MSRKQYSGCRFSPTCDAGAILRPAATPLWKLGQLVMLGGTSMFPLFRSTVVFLGGARPRCSDRNRAVSMDYKPVKTFRSFVFFDNVRAQPNSQATCEVQFWNR